MATIKHIDRLEKRLDKFRAKITSTELEVGFMEKAKYPDGTYVAQVAFDNEFGTKEIPSRPFFRTMISKESPTWGKTLTGFLHFTHYDVEKSMNNLGEDVMGALTQSIRDWQTPPNSPKTIERKGFNKPLIDTSHMIKSVTKNVVAKND